MFDEATRPFQYARARAGVDALTARSRVTSEPDPQATVVSLHGRSAYDCIFRAAFLHKLQEVAPALLPFVRMFYMAGPLNTVGGTRTAPVTAYLKQRGANKGTHWPPHCSHLGSTSVCNGPARHSVKVKPSCMAFPDDLYLVLPDAARAREAIDEVTGCVEAHSGIAANRGKTRVSTSRAGLRRPEWLSWALTCVAATSRWRNMGSSPMCTAEYTRAWRTDRFFLFFFSRTFFRLDLGEALLRQLPQMPDLQCAWLLLCYCAAPRPNHALRTIPPSLNEPYAAGTLPAFFFRALFRAASAVPASEKSCASGTQGQPGGLAAGPRRPPAAAAAARRRPEQHWRLPAAP